MTTRAQIESILADGPATATEIAPELGIDKRRLNSNMVDLARRGLLTREPFHMPLPLAQCSRRVVWMYSLPEQAGRAA
jgi:predicted ArsR family transcriptional regulator